MKIKKCIICNKDFLGYVTNQKYCSINCQKKTYNRRAPLGENLPSGTVGAMAEMYIAGELLKMGYSVFRSLSPSCYCDFIIMKDGILFQVEARTGYMNKNGKLFFPDKLRKTADTYAIWERNTGKIYFLNSKKEIIDI